MQFKRSVIKLDLYGKKYTLTRPKVKDCEAAVEIMASEDTNKRIPMIKQLVIECGLPGDVVEDMEFSHMDQLAEELLGTKKN